VIAAYVDDSVATTELHLIPRTIGKL
jgi:hypothetical protein